MAVEAGKASDARNARDKSAYDAAATGSTAALATSQAPWRSSICARARSPRRRPVGFFPLGAALSPEGLLVANEGLLAYRLLPSPVPTPPFGTPPADPLRAQTLSLLGVTANGALEAAPLATVPLDRSPDGLVAVGGAHPAAIAALAASLTRSSP